jgi:hypothetical protein
MGLMAFDRWRRVIRFVVFIFVLGLDFAGAQSVLTQHNDNQRTGAQLRETQLTPSNLSQSFGLLYTLDVSSPRVFPVANSSSPSATSGRRFPNTIGSQPLYVSRVLINGTPREVLYVTTRQNWIFAFDVGNAFNLKQRLIWKIELRDPRGFGAEELPGMEYRFSGDDRDICSQTRGPVGIASTPVIDEASNTMWVIYRTSSPLVRNIATEKLKFPRFIGPPKYDAEFWIVKIDIRTGAQIKQQRINLPPPADPHWADRNLTRTGLLLLNGFIYVGFAGAVCDDGGGPNDGNHYHGWIVKIDADKLTLEYAVPTTSTGFAGGIWQSGAGLAADHTGYIFALTGNHEGGGAPEYGDSFLRIDAKSLDVRPYTPPNWQNLNNPSDSDLASGGPVVLPNGLVLGGGKPGMLYLVNPAKMTINPNMATLGFQAFYNSWHPEIPPCFYDQYQGYGPNIHGAPVVWHPEAAPYALVYHMPEKDYLKGFRAFDDGRMEERPYLTTQESGIRSPRGMPGGALSLSASGGHNGILWVSVIRQEEGDGLNTSGQLHGRLIAFDALTLETLWEAPEQDVPFAKYIPPTIGGGKVFRSAYADVIYVYGMSFRPVTAPTRGTTTTGTSALNRAIKTKVSAVPLNLLRGSLLPTRPIKAVWRGNPATSPIQLDLFMTGRQMGGGSVLNTNWMPGPCESRVARAWRGWYPVDSDYIPNYGDTVKLPPDYSFVASGAAPVMPVWRDLNHLDIFVADNNGRVMNISYTPVQFPSHLTNPPASISTTGWTGWKAVPGITVAPRQPITAYWRNPNHLDLFTVARDGRVMSTYQEGGGWVAWFPVAGNTPLAVPGQEVTAVWRNANHLDLFITDRSGHVLSTYFEGNKWQAAWFPIDPQSGVATPGQTVTALWRNANHLDLFITAADGKVLSTYFDNNKWQTAWFPVSAAGAAAAGQLVTALWRNANHLDLFITGKDGKVMSTYFDNNRWQSGWFAISPATALAEPGQPVTAMWAPERSGVENHHLDLFITGKDGRVMSIFFDNNQWQPAWFPI